MRRCVIQNRCGRLAALMVLSLLLGVSWEVGQPDLGSAAERSTGVGDPGRPPEILSLRHEILPGESYRDLAGRWKGYLDRHPDDARGFVEWGDALRYSGKVDEARDAYRRAYETDSEDPTAVAAYTCFILLLDHESADWADAHQLVWKAVRRDSACADALYTLWLTGLHEGDPQAVHYALRRLVDTGDLSRPLLDYGHNMLAGAPRRCVIFTNGDNDTYPPLAAQVLRGFRPDVQVVNLSLLNTRWYIRKVQKEGLPLGFGDEEIEGLKHRTEAKISDQVQRRLLERLAGQGWPLTVCYAITVPGSNRGAPVSTRLEGLLERVTGLEVEAPQETFDLDRTRELLDSVYRLESMRDPWFDWTRNGAVVRLGFNTAALEARVGLRMLEGVPSGGGGRYLLRAISYCAFHGLTEEGRQFLKGWEEASPADPLLPEARALLAEGG